jgi:regulatory protein
LSERASATASGRAAPDAWQTAVRLLALRSRTSEEVRRLLTRRGFGPDDVARALARLTAARYLDDAQFTRAWLAAKTRQRLGPARLSRELRAKGVSEALIEQALDELNRSRDPLQAADDAARRKLPALARLPRPIARRRLAGFLERRGFSADIIVTLCRRYLGGEDVE